MIHRVIPVPSLLHPFVFDLMWPILSAILHKELVLKVGPGSATQIVSLEQVIHGSDSWSWLLSP